MPVSWAQAGGAARFADTNSRCPVKFELQINPEKMPCEGRSYICGNPPLTIGYGQKPAHGHTPDSPAMLGSAWRAAQEWSWQVGSQTALSTDLRALAGRPARSRPAWQPPAARGYCPMAWGPESVGGHGHRRLWPPCWTVWWRGEPGGPFESLGV